MNSNLENKKFLNDVLKRNYYYNPEKAIDLIFSNETPDKCMNCYLSKDCHFDSFASGKKKYHKETIINNLKEFINWYNQNSFSCNINLKNADIFLNETDYYDILVLLSDIQSSAIINIYTSLNFLNNEKLTDKILDVLNKTEKNINFNINLNGLFCDPEPSHNENFYNKVLNFIQYYPYKFDAIITSKNVSNWINNYKWWIANLGENALLNIRLIEENSSDWELNSIGNYTQFLDFQVDFLSQVIPNFISYIFSEDDTVSFSTIKLNSQQILNNKKYYRNCDFHNNLVIDIQNFTLLLCSKINYESLIIGKYNFETQNWDPSNTELIIIKDHLKRSSTPHCEKCQFIELCQGFCYGAAFEKSYNLLIPIRQFCDLIHAKYSFLIYKYNNLNLLMPNILKSLGLDNCFLNYLNDLKSQIISNL